MSKRRNTLTKEDIRAKTIASERERGFKISRSEYREGYLRSDAWRELRKIVLGTGIDCQRCKKVPAYDVHHVMYRDDIESTVVTDLLPLCRKCHQKVHRAIGFKLIPDPKRTRLSGLKHAIARTLSVTDEEISSEHSRKQTKEYLSESLIKEISEADPNIRKRCHGLLKCLSVELEETKFSNYRIDKVRGLLRMCRNKGKKKAFIKSLRA